MDAAADASALPDAESVVVEALPVTAWRGATFDPQIVRKMAAAIGADMHAVGVHQGTHLGVSYFRELCPPSVRKAFTALAHIVMSVFGAVMAVQGYKLTLFKWDAEIPLIHVPEGLRVVPVTVCGVLIVLFSIGHLIMIARGVEEPSNLVG